MKAEIKEWNELSDSREFLEARPTPIGLIFLYIIIFILGGALIWSYFSEIDEVVKAQGVARPIKGVSTVTNKVLGRVEEIKYEQGSQVEAGDKLFIVEHKDLIVEKEAVESELNRVKKKLDNLQRFKKSVKQEKNLLATGNDLSDYYSKKFNQYQKQRKRFKQDILQATTEKRIIEDQNIVYEKTISEEKKEIKNKLSNLELLKSSILQMQNKFTDNNSTYQQKYTDYKHNLNKLKQVVTQRKRSYKTSKQLGEVVPKNQLKEEKERLERAELDLEQYKNEYLLNINQNMQNCRERLREIKNNELQLIKPVETYNEEIKSRQINFNKLESDILVEINEQIKQYEDNEENLENRLKSIQIKINNSKVKAPVSGTVNIIKNIKKGDLLQVGTKALTIIPQNNEAHKMHITMHNEDIAKVNEGDDIHYRFSALPYREYGELSGEITKISADTIMDQEGGGRYYLVEATVNSGPVYNQRGEKAFVRVGMEAESSIVVDSKKVIHYLLEKINLR